MQLKATLSKFIIISIFCLGGIAQAQPNQEGVVIDKIIAKVDDYIVLKSDLEQSYLNYLSQGQPRSEEARCGILESLVVNKMMAARAEIDSVEVTDAEVRSNVDRRVSAILAGIGSESEVEKQYGKSLDQIKSELFESIKEQMLVQRMQGELTAGMEVSPAEVRRFFKKIPRDSLPYFSSEVKVAQIVMKPDPGESQKEKVRQQMLSIRKQIMSGTSFESLARKYSEDGSAPGGGELPYYKRGEVAPAFEASAMTLEIGELSEPVESDFGFHLIQLQDRKGNSFKTRHILVIPKPSPDDYLMTEQFLDSLRNQIFIDSADFQAVAKEHSDDQFTSSNGGYFADQQTGSLSVSVETLDPGIFFAIDTMKIGDLSKPMRYQEKDGSYAYRVLYYKGKTPPHLANLDDDYQKIATAALNSKQNKKLNEWFLEAKNGVFIEIDPEYKHCGLN
ncbi:MAG: peptidylprolyl isomerase [Cytophagales bacterium]|nr:peptidylprolyl isomerase [Cytophagales bacterium]